MGFMHDAETVKKDYSSDAIAAGLAAVLNWQTGNERTIQLMHKVGEHDAATRLSAVVNTIDEIITRAMDDAENAATAAAEPAPKRTGFLSVVADGA